LIQILRAIERQVTIDEPVAGHEKHNARPPAKAVSAEDPPSPDKPPTQSRPPHLFSRSMRQ
jgi:hypothetical protein